MRVKLPLKEMLPTREMCHQCMEKMAGQASGRRMQHLQHLQKRYLHQAHMKAGTDGVIE